MTHQRIGALLLSLLLVAGLTGQLAWAKGPARLSYVENVSHIEQPAVLQAGVRQTVYQELPVSDSMSEGDGVIVQAGSHQPLSGVSVSVPALGFSTGSGADGRFELPQLPDKPTIVAFSHQGYAPLTATLDADSQRRPLRFELQALQNTVVIDDQIRHLGDNSYSPASAGAANFRRASEGPGFIRQFILPPGSQPGKAAVLQIGSVIGLDTLQAHALGQSAFHRASTPMQVRLNGRPVGEIAANGDQQRLMIPAGVLTGGVNTVEVRTGYESPDGTSIDYDDMELMLLTLRL